MDRQTDFLLNISVLYRSTQKYYDRMLQSIQLTYAQLPILIMIFEQEELLCARLQNLVCTIKAQFLKM